MLPAIQTLCDTSVHPVNDTAESTLEGDSISGALKCQAKLPLLHTPVMENRVHFVVHQPPLHRTIQHWLQTRMKVTPSAVRGR